MTGFSADIDTALAECAVQITDPAGRRLWSIDEEKSSAIARQFDCPIGRVHEAALTAGIWPLRYLRNHDSLSAEDQKLLLQSCVAVVGAGGLGGHVMQLLARLGIGRIVIADDQDFDESNLNRQVFARTDTIGTPKVDAAASIIAGINPAVAVEVHRTRVTETNVDDFLAGARVAVDATDNIGDRLLLQAACGRNKIPLVHGALAGFEGQIMTIFPGDRGLRAFYEENGQNADAPPAAEALLGVPAIAPALIASLQAMEVIKILLHRDRPLQNRMLYAEIESGRFSEFNFS